VSSVDEVPAPLRREVRHLGALLGRVIEEAEGADLLAEVERLRHATIAQRREPGEDHRRRALELARAMEPDRAERVARAFTVYFQLVNLAEERHRIRALSQSGRGDDPVPESVAEAIRAIRDELGEAELRRAIEGLEISPVLTAHPTEARRRAVVETLWRIAALLERFDDPRQSRAETAEVDRRLLEEITALWHTDPLRAHAPDPLDEVRAAMALFDETIFPAVPTVYREVDEGLGPDGGARPPLVHSFLRWGTWIGGDRDGNPNVTAEVTRAAAEIAFDHVTRGLEAAARRIGRAVAVSDGHAPPSDELRASLRDDERRFGRAAGEVAAKFPESSHRRKLALAAQRLYATRLGHPDGYADADELLSDLRVVQGSLADAGASRVAFGELQNLIWQTETFGFHLASLELREHADAHRAALEELLPGIAKDAEALDRLAFGDETPAVGPASERTGSVLDALRAMGEIQRLFGPQACRRYVVSFTRSAADVVGVRALARLALPDGALALDVVPLFESRADLEAATRVLDDLFALPGMRGWLAAHERRLEVMLGYSDSAKDAGVFAASLALYRAQGELAAWAAKNGVVLELFHGRGGALGRGGGPAGRAILGQAAASVGGRFKITEQGEVTFARYGNRRIAIRHLEQIANAVLLASTPRHERDAAAGWERFGPTAERIAEASERAYRSLVERDGFAAFFARTTPADEISGLRIGSRPARRADGEDLDQLRAIPWVFAWTQNRCNLPGWYGLGSGLEAVGREPGGLDELRDMHRAWGFFTSFVENAELSLAKADMPVAQLYLALGERPDVAETIQREFELTERLVLEITGHERPLSNRPILRRAIDLRNPYVDALSFLQVRFLAERRAGGLDTARDAQIDRVVKITINGVAAGLQNTG
jgi:phosphoenolpyruvate carboxylase